MSEHQVALAPLQMHVGCMGRKLKGKRNLKMATGTATVDSVAINPVNAGEKDMIWFDSPPILGENVTLILTKYS